MYLLVIQVYLSILDLYFLFLLYLLILLGWGNVISVHEERRGLSVEGVTELIRVQQFDFLL